MTAHRRDVESKNYKAHKLVKHLIEERLIEDFDDLSGLKTVIQCYHDYDYLALEIRVSSENKRQPKLSIPEKGN